MLTKLIERIIEVFKEQQRLGALRWPEHDFGPKNSPKDAEPAVTFPPGVAWAARGVHHADTLAALPPSLRCHVRMRAARPASCRRISSNAGAGPAELAALATAPLGPAALGAPVARRSREQRGIAELRGGLPFSIKDHPTARTELAISMIKRLDEDVQFFARQQNALKLPQLLGFFGEHQQASAPTLRRRP